MTPGSGGGGFSTENPRKGGGLPREGGVGEGLGGCVRGIGGGGAKYFFPGRNAHQGRVALYNVNSLAYHSFKGDRDTPGAAISEEDSGWPLFGSVRSRFVHGTVRAVSGCRF